MAAWHGGSENINNIHRWRALARTPALRAAHRRSAHLSVINGNVAAAPRGCWQREQTRGFALIASCRVPFVPLAPAPRGICARSTGARWRCNAARQQYEKPRRIMKAAINRPSYRRRRGMA